MLIAYLWLPNKYPRIPPVPIPVQNPPPPRPPVFPPVKPPVQELWGLVYASEKPYPGFELEWSAERTHKKGNIIYLFSHLADAFIQSDLQMRTL